MFVLLLTELQEVVGNTARQERQWKEEAISAAQALHRRTHVTSVPDCMTTDTKRYHTRTGPTMETFMGVPWKPTRWALLDPIFLKFDIKSSSSQSKQLFRVQPPHRETFHWRGEKPGPIPRSTPPMYGALGNL